MNPIMNTQPNETHVSEAMRGRTNRVSCGNGSRILMRLAALVMVFCAWTVRAADINVLIIGSSKDSTDDFYINGSSAPFLPAAVGSELQKILAGSGRGTANVVVEDRGNLYGLAQWFHYPVPADVETTVRWPNLRGELGVDWDYVVLIGDPYTMECLPGLYAQGVAQIAGEVAKGGAETILLMPWPAEGSGSTVAHYREVVNRVGISGGYKVAPAGLAWELSGSSRGAKKPSVILAALRDAAETIHQSLGIQA